MDQKPLGVDEPLLTAVDTHGAYLSDIGGGLPLAVAPQPYWKGVTDVLLGSAAGALSVYCAATVFPSMLLKKRPDTVMHLATRMGIIGLVFGAFESSRMRRIGIRAAETQRRADSKIVARILDKISFSNR